MFAVIFNGEAGLLREPDVSHRARGSDFSLPKNPFAIFHSNPMKLRVKKEGVMKSIALFVFLLFVPAAFAIEKMGAQPQVGDQYSVAGYVEDIMRGSVKLYGSYYYIEGAKIRDAAGNALNMNAVIRGSKVEIKFKKESDADRIVEVILVHGPIGEGDR